MLKKCKILLTLFSHLANEFASANCSRKKEQEGFVPVSSTEHGGLIWPTMTNRHG
jgi:hypothetical protein